MSEKRWISETAFRGARLSLEVGRVLHEEKTEQHSLDLIENSIFGKVLMLDGAVQVTTADEFIYHEMMAHVPIIGHGAARDVLIIGGGDCGLAEEVLKHNSVRTLTQIEIDATVVDFSKQYFAEFNAPVFSDPRFHLEIADGAIFAATTERRFDVILIDSTDPVGPGAVLFTEEFYRNLRRCLQPGGVVVTQNGVPFIQRKEFSAGMRNLSKAFEVSTCYVISVPTYFGGHMALGWSSDSREPHRDNLTTLTARAEGLATRYYTPEVHQAAFALPRYIAEAKDQTTA